MEINKSNTEEVITYEILKEKSREAVNNFIENIPIEYKGSIRPLR